MPTLVWDQTGQRRFESGLDHGVLYLSDGTAVPWNGLTSIVESPQSSSESVFFDGQKVNELIQVGDYKATMKAVTYPREFEAFEGVTYDAVGVFYSGQKPKMFNLSYRTLIGSDDNQMAGYKIHLLYNVMAVPSDKTYASIGDDPSLIEFEWSLSAIPEDVPGHRPTAHITIDSRRVDPLLLKDLEDILYGSDAEFAALPTMSDMVEFMTNWYRIQIVDNGDGTWVANSDIPGLVVDNGDGTFEITDVEAIYLDADTYQIFTTAHPADVPLISVDIFANGVWAASADSDALIEVNPDGTFVIYNIDAQFAGADTYRITDTF